jgi:hypothetical protein
MVQVGKKPAENGEVYKTSGSWGKAGSPKMVPVFMPVDKPDMLETELQLNRYRVLLNKVGVRVARMQVQCTVRDGGVQVATSRGISRNTYMIPVKQLPDDDVELYFARKQACLTKAMQTGEWTEPCSETERWEDNRCKSYCDVKLFCEYGRNL